jgi:hypothetical protein
LGLALLVTIVAVPVFGYYWEYVRPTRDWAGRIAGETVVTVGDVAERMQTMARLNSVTGTAPLGSSPFEVLRGMMEEELMLRAASRLRLDIADEDIDEALRERFIPGGGGTPEQLEREFQEEYGRFLTRGRLEDREYREFVRAQVVREVLRQEMGNRVPRVAEQVEVSWMVLPADFDEVQSVLGLLEAGEPFESVAASLNTDHYYSDPSKPGYVGWVPRGAFPQLDPYIFDESGRAGTLAQPVFTREGVYVIEIISEPVVGEIQNEKMMERLKDGAITQWINQEWSRQGVELDFTSDDYAWVVDHVRDNLPSAQ